MIKHHQTHFYAGNEPGVTRGNCWQTAIASVLDLPLEEVPHFVDIDERGEAEYDWWNDSIQWLWKRGYDVHAWENEAPDTDEYVLVTGKSPRGDFHHVVIYKDGKLAHDPHPSGAGVLTEEHFTVIRQREDLPEN